MLSVFPEFKKLQIEDREEVENITQKHPPFCEFSTVSLLTWYDIVISVLNNNLVLKLQRYYRGNKSAYAVLGTTNIDRTLLKIIQYAEKTGGETELVLIPEPVIHSITSPEKFIWNEDRDHFDYIMSAEEMHTLRGGNNMSKRKLVKHFLKKYPEYEFKVIDLNSKKNQKDIARIYTSWAKSSHKPVTTLRYEFEGVMNLLPYLNNLSIIAFGLYYHAKPISFMILEMHDKPYSTALYMKSDLGYKGITEVMYKLTGEYLYKNGYNLINFEADLGLHGLRRSKILRHPVHFLKKYNLSIK